MSILDETDVRNSEIQPDDRARLALQQELGRDDEAEAKRVANQEGIEEALQKERILEAESTRVKSRVLFITNNTDSLTDKSDAQQRFVDLTEVFDEVHVFVLVPWQSLAEGKESVRIHKRAWLYPVSSRWLRFRARASLKAASQQLQFLDGFRPDIIVALDPFESAEAAHAIATKYRRPWQVHVLSEQFLNEERFLKRDPKANRRRLRVAKRMLRLAPSIRTRSSRLLSLLKAAYTIKGEIQSLPQFYHIESFLKAASSSTKKSFDQFAFTMLFVGDLTADSTLHRALDAGRSLMRTPNIGFVVIGTGPNAAQFRERAKLLKIDKQVVFLGQVDDLATHMQAADVLVMTDKTPSSEEIVIKAAAVGMPIIAAVTDLRTDLFTDGQHAFLVEEDIPLTYAKALQQLLNNVTLRTSLGRNAQKIVRDRIEEDPRMYRIAYRDSIEDVLFAEGEAVQQEESEALIKQAHKKALARSEQFTVVDGMEMKLPG